MVLLPESVDNDFYSIISLLNYFYIMLMNRNLCERFAN